MTIVAPTFTESGTTYWQGSDLPDLALTWKDPTGALINLTGHTFTAKVSPKGSKVPSFIKTTGITGAASEPNLTITWSIIGELNSLAPGVYSLHVTALRTADNKERIAEWTIHVRPSPGFVASGASAVQWALDVDVDAHVADNSAHGGSSNEIVTTRASYGAKCDARTVADVVTDGTAVITSATAAFIAADVGKVASLRVGAVGRTTTIASYQSPTQVTLATTAPAGTAGILTYGTDDTVAIQSAIAAMPEGGTLVQPAESIISAALTVTKSMTIRGAGVAEVTGGIIDSSFGSGPSLAPYLRGSVFIQVTASANGINITGTGVNVHLRDFGVRFGPGIMFSNTGHGIYAVPTALFAGGPGHENGLFNPRWDSVEVFGHDGNHYAFYILNSNLGTFTHLRWHGGGGLFLESDSHGAGYGNATYVHPYGRVFCGGSANGFTLKCRDIDPNQPSLNLLTFLRPQCNVLSSPVPPSFAGLGITPPTVAQYNWRNIRTGTLWPRWVDIIDPDLENDGVNTYPVDFGGMYSGTIVRNGGIISAVPINGYSTENRQNPGVPLQPTLAEGPGLGTGGTASVISGNDQGGNLLLTPGSSGVGAAGTVIVTVTCPSMPPDGIKAVLLQPYADINTTSIDFFADGLADGSKSFQMKCKEALFPGYPYQLMFHVIPRNTPNNTV